MPASATALTRAPRNTLNGSAPGIQIAAKMRPRSRPVRACPGTDAPDGLPTIDAMPLQIPTQPDPDHFCETCRGPSELVSQTITSWDGNETMARECRRGHHGVQTHGARAADHGIRR